MRLFPKFATSMNKTVTLYDKSFEIYLDEKQIHESVQSIANQLNEDYRGQKVLFISILNGSFMFTSDLMKLVDVDMEISFMKVRSYVGTESSGRVDELIGLTTSVTGKNLVILEDIVDTGITVDKIIKLLQIQNPNSIEVCAMLFKKEAFQGQQPPKYFGFEIPNKFVVGYGLDYDEAGRNLPEIYQLIEK
jgi:hypoxanthine phosphoribosyltransferase